MYLVRFLARATETAAGTAAAADTTAAPDGSSRYAALPATATTAAKPTAEDGKTSAGQQSWAQTSAPASKSFTYVVVSVHQTQ